MKKAVLILLVVLGAGAAGFWFGLRQPTSAASTPENSTQLTNLAAGHALYVCPMHSHVIRDHPGTCPICGMDLVLMKNAAGATNQVYVDTATQQKLGVQLSTVEPAALTRDILTYGTMVPDESAVLRITPNVEGLLTRLNVNRVGQQVARGQVLYEISSQEALNLQYEYVDILRRGEPTMKMAGERREQNRVKLENARDLEPAERKQVERSVRQSEEQLWSLLQPLERDRERVKLRLRQIGFTDEMLMHLTHTARAFLTVPVRAPHACVVQNVTGRPGMMVGAMTDILDCVDASHAMIEIVLYPDQIPRVEEGNVVTMAFGDGETVTARLAGLNPLVDAATRTLKVRMPVVMKHAPNLGEYVKVTIHATPRQVLAVPKSAVMRTGRGDYVMRALGRGHFMPVKVLTGIETDESIAIRDGLDEGDQVAVNGNFLIDAAASLADAAQRMRAADSHSP